LARSQKRWRHPHTAAGGFEIPFFELTRRRSRVNGKLSLRSNLPVRVDDLLLKRFLIRDRAFCNAYA